MKLKTKSVKQLQQVMKRDYGLTLSAAEVERFGLSLLNVTHIAKNAFNRNS